MPVYFAYGSNLDRTAMTQRCPGAVPLGPGVLAQHRFFVMANGYASVRSQPGATVHGLVWTVPESDMPALDAYEEVDDGLYRKTIATIFGRNGASIEAMIYVGQDEAIGRPVAGYMEGVLAAAAAVGLPAAYRDELRLWLP